MKIQETAIEKLVTLRLNPGDDILRSLRDAVDRAEIQNGLILNGLGSVSAYHWHVVSDDSLPPAECYIHKPMPCDILGFSGAIIDGRVHAHISLSNEQVALGGHLEEGTKVLTFAVIMIAITPEADFREYDRIGSLD